MEKNEVTAPQTMQEETLQNFVKKEDVNTEQLPAGWRRDKNGAFVYTPFPEEIREMRREENIKFALGATNVVQALFIALLVLSHFCSR